MGDHIVELQTLAFAALDELCSQLTAPQWELDTDCPGWSVKDNLSHIVGTESRLLGRTPPEHTPDDKPWIRNPIGAGNEVDVDYRRVWDPLDVLEEFREVASERIKDLAALSDEELSAESWTPIGPGTVRDLLAVRVMDFWVHEQDIRRAVGKPGGLEGPLADHAFVRHRSAVPFVVGKKAGAPDGTEVVVEVAGQQPFGVVVEGRARLMEQAPAGADVRLSMDLDTFNRLCCGRGAPAPLIAQVQVEGDAELAGRILENFNFMI